MPSLVTFGQYWTHHLSYSAREMGNIKRLLVFFQSRTARFSRYLAAPRADAIQSSPLVKLPTELLQKITNHLPTVSAASFSLSCRHIYLSIGTQYLENLASSYDETLVFLNLWEHDLQNHIVCHFCRKFHRIRDARKYTEYGHQVYPEKVKPGCLSHDRNLMVTFFIHENFSATVFKMAMKHYRRFGHDAQGRKLLSLLSGNASKVPWDRWFRKQKAECQIKNGSLLTCVRTTFHGTCAGAERQEIFAQICPHLEFQSVMGRPANLRIAALSPLPDEERWSMLIHNENRTNIEKTSWGTCSELQQCLYCRTEYTTGFKHNDGCTIKFTIIIWKDLGRGPEADEWKAHFPLEDIRSFPKPGQFHRGDIPSVFQGRGELGRG